MLAVLIIIAGCDRFRESPRLVVDGDTIDLPAGTRIHEVLLAAPDGAVAPDTVRIRPGDVVRFVAEGLEAHAVVFDEGALAPEPHSYLSEGSLLRGPPLVERGTGWVVSFPEAPRGSYPFRCIVHDVGGTIIIEGR